MILPYGHIRQRYELEAIVQNRVDCWAIICVSAMAFKTPLRRETNLGFALSASSFVFDSNHPLAR